MNAGNSLITHLNTPMGNNAKGDKSTQKPETSTEKLDFIRQIIADDVQSGKHPSPVTRFPPEPNGYLHIGHAKALCLSFGAAEEFSGRCHLRMDDTNPAKEDVEYENGIKRDVEWLGFQWGDHLYHASDYYEKLYTFALHLITEGLAYVDSSTADEIRTARGTLTEPGKPTPFRNRSIEENLDLFKRMRAGEFADGEHVLRAKIDMASPNLNMRDPVIYRLQRVSHYRTGDTWCIYPLYDFAHPLSDALEGVTHSLCSLEFENHRPLYDWCIAHCPIPGVVPRQIEFARLSLTNTVMSKRKLLQLVQEKLVNGWDDPRMPTLSGMRRRGYPAAAIRNFCKTIGLTKFNSLTDLALLEHSVRESLNKTAPRFMAVLAPLKVVITNWPDGHTEEMHAVNNPEDPEAGKRPVSIGKEIFIEQDDFMEDPPKKYFRLRPGGEVRLRYSYCIICQEIIKDADGNITELHCTYDPDTLGKNPEGRKVKAAIHWVSASHAINAELRLYDRLFTHETPDSAEGDFKDYINPDSVEILTTAKLEPAAGNVEPGTTVQFERTGYFCADTDHIPGDKPIFNRTVNLKDSWAKAQAKG
ncbi:MAG: glutaminyl-tRNA synthetase [Verrucomicrobiales bacterium]|jgi:glutaminyl-tRNA synthetase